MAKSAKIERAQKEFIKNMKKKFSEDFTTVTGVAENRKVGHHVTLVPYAEPRKHTNVPER